LPGIAITLTLWLIAGAGFGAYLESFPDNYVVTYAGLASAMIALAFLYFSSVIFIYGGELNAALIRRARDES
jgi:membrane protein